MFDLAPRTQAGRRTAAQSLEVVVILAVSVMALLFFSTIWKRWFDPETRFGIVVTVTLIIASGYAIKHLFVTVNIVTDAVIIKALSDGRRWDEKEILAYVKSQRWAFHFLASTIIGRLSTLVSNGRVTLVDQKYQISGKANVAARDQDPPKARVFVSYRHADSANMTGRMRDHLNFRFGSDSVFMDVHSIIGGSDFRLAIRDSMSKCTHLIVVIGEAWPVGRLHNSNDPVRFEIEEGLRLKLPIIPVLVENARFPDAEALPQSLREFGFRTAVKLRLDPDFQQDIERLVDSIVHMKSS